MPDLSDLISRVEKARGHFSVVLTAADHDQNGFVSLAKWIGMSESTARNFIAGIDAEVSDESEPDIKTVAYTFILDLWDGRDCIDNGKRVLPTQIAMSLAPDQVRDWLLERPDPDSVVDRPIPILCARQTMQVEVHHER